MGQLLQCSKYVCAFHHKPPSSPVFRGREWGGRGEGGIYLNQRHLQICVLGIYGVLCNIVFSCEFIVLDRDE